MITFQDVYDENANKLYAFLLSLSGDQTLADDLLQETFLQAIEHIDRFQGRCSIYTWLCEIGKNLWLKELRHNKHFSDIPIDETSHLPISDTPEACILRKEEYARIQQAMIRLEEPYRNVFILRAYSNIRFKEIAAIYGKSESWARVTYFRAKTRIMEEVTK